MILNTSSCQFSAHLLLCPSFARYLRPNQPIWSQQSPIRRAREELREPTCLPLDGVLSAGRGWRHLRHITGPLIKTHVRQSDRHGKTVWKKLLGIKYIVTTWFQRFINKLTDHLVSIRSDRSTNPGISALGLVGGGRWWLSMRGDIEGKSPCWFQGGPLLTLFQRGSMHVQTPFTPPVFQSLWDRESSGGYAKAEKRHADLLRERKDLLSLPFSLLALTVQQTTQINTIDSACSLQCISCAPTSTDRAKEAQWQLEEQTVLQCIKTSHIESVKENIAI